MRKNNTQNEKQKSVAFKRGQEYKILPSVNETKDIPKQGYWLTQ